MLVYLNENKPKKIFVDESKIRLLRERFDENAKDEGGVYSINNIRKGRNSPNTYMDADYNWNNDNGDDGVYADYTPYGRQKGLLNPLNANWIQLKNNMPYSAQKSARYKQISDADMPNYNPTSDDEFIRHNGILYMPTKRRIMQGKGDVIKDKLTPDKIYISTDLKGQKTFINCYNLTKLGVNNTKLATMIAHTYKGKEAGYGDVNNFKLRVTGNLIRNEYAKKITELIKNTRELYNFNPTYIIFPQSSSKFNDYIAEFLHKDVYPNAKMLPRDILKKVDLWEFDYKDIIYQTIENAESKDNRTKYRKVYSQYPQLKQDFLTESLIRRLTEILSNKLARALNGIIKSVSPDEIKRIKPGTPECPPFINNFNNRFLQKRGVGLSDDEKYRAYLLEKIWFFITDDISEIEVALERTNFLDEEEIQKFKERLLLLTFQATFRRNDVGTFVGRFSSRGGEDRTQNFSDIGTFDNSFVEGNIKINYDGIAKIAASNDTIKNYDKPTRLGLKNQFQFNNDYEINGMFKPSDRFIIIDDNYASGASIRNAARVIMELGIPANNIIGFTPGDMGGASSGGKMGADIPENSAEEYLAYNHVKNNAYQDLPLNVQQILQNTYGKLNKDALHAMQNRTRARQAGNLGKKFHEYTSSNERVPFNTFGKLDIQPQQIYRGSKGQGNGGGRRPYTDEEREKVIQAAKAKEKELIGYRDAAKYRMKTATSDDELRFFAQKKAEYDKKLLSIRAKISNLRKHRVMTQGAKDRANMRRKSKM